MKKVIKIVVDVLAWVLLILAFLVTIMVFTSEKNNGIPSLFGVMPMSVESDSMSPTFKKGDLIFVNQTDLYELKEGDVITFYCEIEGMRVKNTHRIIKVIEENGARKFVTRGDNNPVEDESFVKTYDVIGKWSGKKLVGGGNVLDFLRSKTGFFICIVIPMALFFLFELYKFIVTLVEAKKPKISAEDEEEIKKKAIEEYLAKEKAAKEAEEAAKESENKAEDSDKVTDEAESSNENEEVTEAKDNKDEG